MAVKHPFLPLALLISFILFCTPIYAQESPTESAPLQLQKKDETYLSLFILGTNPKDKDLVAEGIPVTGTQLKSALGGGIKVGRFLQKTRGIFGLEGEFFAHGGEVTAARAFRSSAPSGFTQANGNLLNINYMINLLARYPGTTFQPYAGIGFGLSYSKLGDLNLQIPAPGGTTTFSGSGTDLAFAYQFLAGARAYLNKRLFMFGEYKYFSSDYSWGSQGGGDIKLDFRAQMLSGGVGFAF